MQPAKEGLARRFGATDFIDAGDGDAVARVRALAEGGVDHAFEAIGLEPETQIGPLQNRQQYEKVLEIIEEARSLGNVIAGGQDGRHRLRPGACKRRRGVRDHRECRAADDRPDSRNKGCPARIRRIGMAAAGHQAVQRAERSGGAIAFLTSEHAHFITGQALPVDGGLYKVG